MNNKPLVTFLMCCRIKDNPDTNIIRTLDSIRRNIGDKELDNIEVLIKFDDNDEKVYQQLFNRNWQTDLKRVPGTYEQPNILKTYPFTIRYFQYSQGEGRYSLHNDYKFLFSQRNPNSKFISFITDDCILSSIELINTLKLLKNPNWSIIGNIKPDASKYPDWKTSQQWKLEVTPYPIVSCKLFEILQNMGWQVNIDNWLTLIHVILVNQYNLDLWERIPSFFERSVQSAEYRKQTYNPLDITNLKDCNNLYYFRLIEKQVKNIYLNYLNDSLKNFSLTINR